MTKTVYVTGCLGFIGSYVTRACLDKGWYVRGVDKITYAANEHLIKTFQKYPNFVFEKADINDLTWLYECDYIINTAAETHVDNSIVDSNAFLKSNINGIHNLLEIIRTKSGDYRKPILFHFSTDEVYGDIVDGAFTETDLLKPSNPYSATKAAADQLILAWNRTYNVPYVIIRPTNNYGIGQYVEKLIPKACKYMTIGRKINLHEGGNPTRIWLHAKDTAAAVITIIESNQVNEIYNISGNFEQKNIDTVKKILYCLYSEPINMKKYIDFHYERPGADLRYSIDDSKLRKLGWKPIASFDDELPEIVEHYKNNFIW
jgi:dTDP-glucose 4,6-dehydratase|tara:strand:+ start:493 stop:1443 length:951 start_codon:yes stop_codon:yes gene_type:complete